MDPMNTTAPVLPSGLSMLPADLSRGQRGWLMAAVGLAHVAVAYVVLTHVQPAIKLEEPHAIEVALISDAPVVPAPAPPVKQEKAPAPAANPARMPQPATPPVLASARPAQANEMQVPMPTPVVETKPAAATARVTPAVPTTATPTAQVSEAVRPPVQPVALPFSSVRYLIEPVHNYPRVSQDLGEAGVVKLRVLIDEQGRPTGTPTVVQSSGFPRLDQEAVRAMKAARFQPSIVDGVPRSAWVIAPIVFNLNEQ